MKVSCLKFKVIIQMKFNPIYQMYFIILHHIIIIYQYMFFELLHPQLVLYGQFLNLNLHVHHETSFRDGQLIIHQKINRFASDSISNQIRNQYETHPQQLVQSNDQEFHNEDMQVNQKESEHPTDTMILLDLEDSPEKKKQIQGFYQSEENPYDEQYYGFNMDGQYAPQQFGENENKSSYEDSPSRQVQYDNIPFTGESPLKNSEEDINDANEDSPDVIASGVAQFEFQAVSNDLIDELLLQ